MPRSSHSRGQRANKLAESSGVRPDGSTSRFVQDAPLPAKDGNYVYDKADPSFHGANAFVAANRTLNIFEEAFGAQGKWSRADRLAVHGDEAQDLNAGYDGKALHFFHYDLVLKS